MRPHLAVRAFFLFGGPVGGKARERAGRVRCATRAGSEADASRLVCKVGQQFSRALPTVVPPRTWQEQLVTSTHRQQYPGGAIIRPISASHEAMYAGDIAGNCLRRWPRFMPSLP